MPIKPWQQGVHRIASIALFRALLHRSKAAQLDDQARSELQNVVRNTFKRYRFEESRVRLATFFQDGYEAITLLKASHDGNHKATSTILTHLASAFPKSKEPPPLNPYQKRIIKARLQAASAKANIEARRRRKSFLDTRPNLTLDPNKIRKVPRFVSAGGIPMLRIKKPQPESLSGYIRKRLDVRQRRALQVQALEDEHRTLAEWEDEWEAILKQQGLRRSRAVPKATYVEGVQDALRMIKGRITTENRHHYTIARRMQEIVLKERRLALREKRRRRRGRRRINLRLRKTAAGKRMERKKAESPRSIERKTARGGAKRRRAQLPTLSRQEVGCEEGPGLQRRGGGEEKASIEVRCGRGKGASRENEGSREVRGAKKSVASLVRRTTRAQQTPSKTKTESEVDEVRQRARQVEKVNRRKDKSEETETPSPRKAGQKRSAQEEPREDIMRRMTRGKDAV